MGMSGLWMDSIDDLCDAYDNREITYDQAYRGLLKLGVTLDEIDGWMDALEESRKETDFNNGQFGVGA